MAIGSLAVRVTSDTTQFNRGMSGAGKSARQMRGNLNRVAKTAAKTSAAVAGVGAAISIALVKKGLDAVDAQAKLARSLGGTIAATQGLQRAAGRSGVSMGELEKASEKLSQRIGEAMDRSGRARDTFDELGLSAEALANMDVDERMAALADAMNDAGFNASQTAGALRDLGIRQASFVNLIKDGGDAIRESSQLVRELGADISEIDAAKVEAANDAFSDLPIALEAISNRLAIEVSPAIEAVSNLLVEAIKDAGGFGEMVEVAVNRSVKSLGVMLDGIHGIRVAVKALTLGFQSFGSAALGISSLVLEGWQRLFDQMLSGVQGMAQVVNAIPGVPDMDTSGLVDLRIKTQQAANEQVSLRQEMSRSVQQTASELQELAMMELPSQRLANFFEEAKAKADEAARAIVASREGEEGENGEPADEDRRKKELQQLMTFEDSMTDIAEKGAQARERIAKKEAENKKIVGDAMSGLTTLMNSENRKMFEIGKAAAIGQSLISTWQGMSKALELGWPMGPIAAAAIGATGFANVQSIRSQSFGSGGGGAGSATQQVSGNQQPVQQQAQQETTRNVRVEGLSPGQFVQSETVMEAMEELWKDGAGSGRLIFGGS